MKKDEIKGKFEQVKSKAKNAGGDLTHDEDLYGQQEDEVRGELREGSGRARRRTSDAAEGVGEKLKR